MRFVTEKRVEAIAYGLAERFLKRVGGVNSPEEVDDLAAEIAAAIKAWMAKKRS